MIGEYIEIKTEFGTEKFISEKTHKNLIENFLVDYQLRNIKDCLEIYLSQANANGRVSKDNPHFKQCSANIFTIKELIKELEK